MSTDFYIYHEKPAQNDLKAIIKLVKKSSYQNSYMNRGNIGVFLSPIANKNIKWTGDNYVL